MNRFKPGKSKTTLWRRARAEFARLVSDAGADSENTITSISAEAEAALSDDRFHFSLDAQDCGHNDNFDLGLHDTAPCAILDQIDVNEGGVDTQNFAEASGKQSLQMYKDLEFDDYVGWRWINSDSDSDEGNITEETNLKQDLAEWAVRYNVQQSAVGSLLTTLQVYFPSLPRDPRTLLKTPQHYPVKAVCGGDYCHLGLAKGLTLVVSKCRSPLKHLYLQINIDGIPLFKSANTTMWPILCSVKNCDVKEPFVVGIFCGKEKPGSASEFLSDFVTEACDLLANGLIIDSSTYTVSIHCFVCDAPARAFVKGVKSHSGYSSCEKCTVHGEYVGKVIFSSTDAPLRTDESFNSMIDEGHHIHSCPLNPLPIGFVSHFALDYMHLACLGVMRRFLLYWKGPVGPIQVRLSRNSICELSRRLLFVASYLPVEFARKPRSVDDILRWKATELREFLLYSGLLVLDGLLPDDLYNHFMLLFVAMRILASRELALMYTDYANQLLVKFVHDTGTLYGKEALVYNVHCLVHLAADVKKFGCLDDFSAFIFENKLGKLKKMIRKPQHPIQQLLRRLDEHTSFERAPCHSDVEAVLKMEHNSGPLISLVAGVRQFKRVHTNKFTLSVSSLGIGNCCIMSHSGLPALVKNIVMSRDAIIYLVCTKFSQVSDTFSFPLPSSKLSICKVVKECSSLFIIPLSDVICKCVCWPSLSGIDTFIVVPLLH